MSKPSALQQLILDLQQEIAERTRMLERLQARVRVKPEKKAPRPRVVPPTEKTAS